LVVVVAGLNTKPEYWADLVVVAQQELLEVQELLVRVMQVERQMSALQVVAVAVLLLRVTLPLAVQQAQADLD
jgi:hypothetical protein